MSKIGGALGKKPSISGLQTAVVTGDANIRIPCTADSEKLGRVKVQLHWDREGKRDAKSIFAQVKSSLSLRIQFGHSIFKANMSKYAAN